METSWSRRRKHYVNAQQSANFITMQNVVNCYVRETGKGKWIKVGEGEELILTLEKQPVTLYFPAYYRSLTGRHLLNEQMAYQVEGHERQELDLLTLLALLMKEVTEDLLQINELIVRVLLSYENMKQFIEVRQAELQECYGADKSFLQSEQALLIGHQLHPTPKSRQGILPEEETIFAPELKGKFQLHYFYAEASLVKEGSALEQARLVIKKQLVEDEEVSDEFKTNYCQDDENVLIPMHPLQARYLLGKSEVCDWIQSGRLSYLGPQGQAFYPTSSVRTVYNSSADVMYKFSIPVKITNSLRVNKRKELYRGVEVTELLRAGLEEELQVHHPAFKIIKDFAYVTLGEEELGFEVVIRENPFKGTEGDSTTLLASLCQDHVYRHHTQLQEIIHRLAKAENRSLEAVSQDWFKKYLDISLKPMMWLYTEKGIALEAHQQNSIIKLTKEGYPKAFYYRDNQGYYFMRSKQEDLQKLVKGLNQMSDTVCDDAVAEERFRYYVIFNHLFGLINAFGTSGLIEESKLIEQMRTVILGYEKNDHTNLVKSMLSQESLPCKANLLTRIHDMDELVGSLETQSVYVDVTNPLAVLEGVYK